MITDSLVRYRWIFVSLVVLISIAIVPKVREMSLDRTLKSAYVTHSPAYYVYKYFIEVFGNDEFVLVVIKNKKKARDPAVLRALNQITKEIESFPEISKVISLTNLKMLRMGKQGLGSEPVVRKEGQDLRLPDDRQLQRMKTALPMSGFLISPDMKTIGIMIQINDRWKFDPKMADIQKKIATAVRDNLPEGSEFRMLGAPVIREAVQEITLRTAIIFGVLCTIIIALVSLYIFKSFRVAGIALAVVGLAVHWIVGLMSLLGIQLNSTTSLSFGLVLVVSVATVVHIVTHYYHAAKETDDRVEAVKKALRVVGRPALMCSVTTSIAFATIMVSSIPMVFQLGLIMSLGVLLAFVLSIILTPTFLIVLKPVDKRTQERMDRDWVALIFDRMKGYVFTHYRFCAFAGIGVTLFMIAGAPLIEKDTQILGLFVKSSSVLADIRFAEENLSPIHAVEVVVEGHEKTFKDTTPWKRLAELNRRLLEIPQVVSVDSPLPMFEYINDQLAAPGKKAGDLLSNPALLLDVWTVMNFSAEGKKLLRKYLDKKFSRLHISVRIKNTEGVPIGTTINAIQKAVSDVMQGFNKVIVTGELVVFSDQASEVVKSQVLSLILAFSAITLMMMIQFRSYILGLLSLIPNLLPIAVIFGVMGWLGIALDNVTVFAATIAIGLSVDDTIHYLTHLRRNMISSRGEETDIETSLSSAYDSTAKALISTSLTLFFGFLVLSLTPTKPAIDFGLLGAAAILAALLGDLVFMPAVVLTFKKIKNLVENEIRVQALRAATVDVPADPVPSSPGRGNDDPQQTSD
jgi:predicted RND superfamily exporter protein